jgi:hypothetical protein
MEDRKSFTAEIAENEYQEFSKLMSLAVISVRHAPVGNVINLTTDVFESLLFVLHVFCCEIFCRRPIRLAALGVSLFGSQITYRLFCGY